MTAPVAVIGAISVMQQKCSLMQSVHAGDGNTRNLPGRSPVIV